MLITNALDVFFPNFIPVQIVDLGAIAIVVTVVLGLLRQGLRWHTGSIPAALARRIAKLKLSKIVSSVAKSIGEDGILVKPLLSRSRSRWLAHASIMWGFVGLMITTTLAYLLNPTSVPEPFTWPVRILGNLSGASVVFGCSVFLYRLVTNPAETNATTLYADVVFFTALFLSVITGFLTEVWGYTSDSPAGYSIYVVHLTAVTLLLGSAPFTRFLHAVMVPYFAVFERLRMALGEAGQDVKFKDRRISEFVAKTFYTEQTEDSN